MSNTHSPVQSGECTVCGEVAHYVIGTSPDHGPQAAFTLKLGKGRYCLSHAKEAAEARRPAWQARKDAKREANAAAHKAWLADRPQYVNRFERNAIDTDRYEHRSASTLKVGDVIHFTGGYRRSVQTVERTVQGIRVLLSNGVRTTFLVTEVVAVEVN